MCLWLTFKLDNFQDIAHKVENLLKCSPDSGPWKCSKDEDSGQIEAEFQMERASYITHIDIGKGSRLGVFFVFQIQLYIFDIYESGYCKCPTMSAAITSGQKHHSGLLKKFIFLSTKVQVLTLAGKCPIPGTAKLSNVPDMTEREGGGGGGGGGVGGGLYRFVID